MRKTCLLKGFILFIISFPVALVFSVWAGYMLGTVISFTNYQLSPYPQSNPTDINILGSISTLIYYFYILIFKTKHKNK